MRRAPGTADPSATASLDDDATAPAVATVVLVEDQESMRRHIAAAIDCHPGLKLSGVAGSCEEARRVLDRCSPDVLLTDLDLPDGSGIELIREVCGAQSKTQAMVISVFGDEGSVVGAIEAGATGYLLKDESSQEIGELVRQLVEGGSPISAPIARHLLLRFQQPSVARPGGQGPPPGLPADSLLTDREQEVLTMISRGFSFMEISSELEISGHTVTSHVRHIYKKLNVHSRSEAVYAAARKGLVEFE
jgi:DNA-binding NarL/FixJ family response regulator